MSSSPSEREVQIRRFTDLKKQLDELTGLRLKTINSATYGGWTPAQAKEYYSLSVLCFG
jgi:hypothetical protein